VSFEEPSTPRTPTAGALRLLEAMRILGLGKRTRFYQASTSELFAWCRNAAKRDHGLLPALALTAWPALRALDHRQLPRAYGLYAPPDPVQP